MEEIRGGDDDDDGNATTIRCMCILFVLVMLILLLCLPRAFGFSPSLMNRATQTLPDNIRPGPTGLSPAESSLPVLRREIIGRDVNVQRLMLWLETSNPRKPLYVITGVPGVGKTSLLVKTLQMYAYKSDKSNVYPIVFFDMSCIQDIESLARGLLLSVKQLSVSSVCLRYPGTQSYATQFCNYLRFSTGLVIALDHAEDGLTNFLIESFLDFLEKMLTSSTGVKIVIGSRVSVMSRSAEYVEERLSPLNVDEAAILCTELLPDVSPNVCRRLSILTGGLPLGIILLTVQLQGIGGLEELILRLEQCPRETLALLDSTESIQETSTLSMCFDSCFARLDGEQRICLILCTVFPSHFNRFAARFVLYRNLPDDCALVQTVSVLNGLVSRSMLIFDEENETYLINSLLRTYCQKNIRMDEKVRAERNFCDYYVKLFIGLERIHAFKEEHNSHASKIYFDAVQNLEHGFRLCLMNIELNRLFFQLAEHLGEWAHRIPVNVCSNVFELIRNSLSPVQRKDKAIVLIALAYIGVLQNQDCTMAVGYIEEAEQLLHAIQAPVIPLQLVCIITRSLVCQAKIKQSVLADRDHLPEFKSLLRLTIEKCKRLFESFTVVTTPVSDVYKLFTFLTAVSDNELLDKGIQVSVSLIVQDLKRHLRKKKKLSPCSKLKYTQIRCISVGTRFKFTD